MIEKWQRGPQRIGAAIGFVVLPLLWFLQDRLLYLALGFGPSSGFSSALRYFVMGSISGAILGIGISKAAFALRKGNHRDGKRQLLLYGAIVFTALLSLFVFWTCLVAQSFGWDKSLSSFGFRVPFWLYILLTSMRANLPFQIAVFMLFIGLLMRPRP